MVSVLGIKFQSKYELIKARTITVKALEPTKDKKIKEEEEEEEGKKKALFTLINFILYEQSGGGLVI